jgi:succinyl-diaminopimelate desuccinylase
VRELVDTQRVIDLTSALVDVDTQNPPGNERKVAGIAIDALERFRPNWSEIEPQPDRLSLIATLPHPDGPDRHPTLLINGHLDVVPVRADQWDTDPFTPTVIDGRLYGRGAADMKGGIAAAICALDVLEAAGNVPACNVVFHLVADEEVGGGLGTRALLEAGLIKADACLVPEPTGLGLCIAERGMLQSHVTVHGVPAHGSRPDEGVSAIAHAARIALALQGADFGGRAHPLLGRPSANVGTIRGGSGINTVAEWCRLGIDRRLLPGATEESAIAELRAQIEAAGPDNLRYDLDVVVFAEASELAADDPWVGTVSDAIIAATGETPPTIGMTFTTDARFVRNQAAIPTVVCGPGEVAQAHTSNEWVAIDQLVDATAAYAHLMASFGR